MSTPPWESLSDFIDPQDFASRAIITRGSQKIGEVLGIFDDPTRLISSGDYDHTALTPTFLCIAKDAAQIKAGDHAQIAGRRFDVMQDPVWDGTGMATLHLAEPNLIYNAAF